MLGDEIGNVVDIVVDDNPVALPIVLVLRYLLEAILAGHCYFSQGERWYGWRGVGGEMARDRV